MYCKIVFVRKTRSNYHLLALLPRPTIHIVPAPSLVSFRRSSGRIPAELSELTLPKFFGELALPILLVRLCVPVSDSVWLELLRCCNVRGGAVAVDFLEKQKHPLVPVGEAGELIRIFSCSKYRVILVRATVTRTFSKFRQSRRVFRIESVFTSMPFILRITSPGDNSLAILMAIILAIVHESLTNVNPLAAPGGFDTGIDSSDTDIAD